VTGQLPFLCSSFSVSQLVSWLAVPASSCDLSLCLFLELLRLGSSRSQWPCGLRRGSAADRLLGLRVRIPPEAWMSFSFECCVLSGRGLCVGMITRPEKCCRVWWMWVWYWSLDNEGTLAHWGLLRHGMQFVLGRTVIFGLLCSR
jgi:hypothetical protein